MDSYIPFIVWIACIGISALIIGKFLSINNLITPPVKEGFAGGVSMTSCPSGVTSYITSTGDTMCCDGDVVGDKCNGTNICSLSPNTGSGIQSCSEWMTREWKKRSDRFCSSNMPHYFGKWQRGSGNKEGCSASIPTMDGSEPYQPTEPQCKIYQSRDEEIANADSCYNIKALDNLVCPQANATKSIASYPVPGRTMPVILKCNYMPPSGKMPVDCMDDKSITEYLRKSGSSDKDISNWLKVCVAFCGASKAYYVDRTSTKPNAQCVNDMSYDAGSGGAKGATAGTGPVNKEFCEELRKGGIDLSSSNYAKTAEVCKSAK